MLRFLKQRNRQGIDPVVLGVRSNEFDERDTSAKIESHDHPKIAPSDLKPCTFAIQNFCIRRGKADIIHRLPSGSFEQRSPSMKRGFRFRVPFGVRSQYAPGDNSHVNQYVPKTGTGQWPHKTKTAGQ
jgi:hypothetical protein